MERGRKRKSIVLGLVIVMVLTLTIGYSAISRSLTNITIPNSVTTVASGAFNGWESSQTINIDNTSSYVSSNWDSNWNDSSATINYLRT